MAQNMNTQPRVKKKRRNWSKGEDQKLLIKALTYYKLREDDVSAQFSQLALVKEIEIKKECP